MTPQEIYQLIAPELVLVEDELRGYTRSDITPISEIGKYLLTAGGKRIRPALLLLTARMLGDVSPMAIRLAAVVEFLHNATLVHDDVIDGADMDELEDRKSTRLNSTNLVCRLLLEKKKQHNITTHSSDGFDHTRDIL